MDTPWRISLFGALRAERGATTISRFATTRVSLLLGYLAMQPRRTHPREELVEILWPESDPDDARNRLRVALASLRRQLEPSDVPAGSVLIADRSSLRLNPEAFQCDVVEFETALKEAARATSVHHRREALARAIDLYAGELFPGLYDEWVIDERERLTALYEEAYQKWRDLPPVEISAAPLPPKPPTLSDAVPTINLPVSLTRFFGREQETSGLAELLSDPTCRLITLSGPGGVGKTRLAIEAARRATHSFDGPVCFVPLADLANADLIPAAVVSALHLAAADADNLLEGIAGRLAGTRSLLLLDNLEHLGEPGALKIRSLLEHVPGLTCLVTTQGRLSLEGEREFPVGPLPTPHAQGTPAGLIKSPSVGLFLDRAQAVRPDFQVTVGNSEAVAAVCRDLEGLPLALELAAARIGALTPRQMQEQLEARLDFLVGRRHDLPVRHRSLRATLEWSELLLTPELALFFRHLCVFRGGWTLEAAVAVCNTPSGQKLLELTEGLRERSLITAEETEHGMRFRMLEAMREFGAEGLSPEARQALCRRHADYFASVAAKMGALWYGPEQTTAQQTLDIELANIRAALTFCRTDLPDTEWDGGRTALVMTGWMGDYWITCGLVREGLEWLEYPLTREGPPADRARALTVAGHLAAGLGLYERAEAALTESLTISQGLGDGVAAAGALRRRGLSALWRRNYPQAAADFGESLALGRSLGNDMVSASALVNLGNIAHHWRQDDIEAGALYEEALTLLRRVGDRQRASYCLYNLANIAHDSGDDERAEALVQESMALADSLGEIWHRAYCLTLIGELNVSRNNLTNAQISLAEAQDLFHRVGDRRMEADAFCALAFIVRQQNDFAQAEAAYEAALALRQELSDAPNLAECWVGLAETANSQGRWAEAVRRLGVVETQNLPVSADICSRFDLARQAARAALGDAAFETAWERSVS